MANKSHEKDLFFPYYVNQSRLLDIYAILNGGYSEYEEISASNSQSSKKDAKGQTSASAGFKIFKLSGNAEASTQTNSSESNALTLKKVQTVTSILSVVIEQLKAIKKLKKIEEAKEGSFVLLPVTLKINSIKNMFNELTEIVDIIELVKKSGAEIDLSKFDKKQYKFLSDSIKTIFNGQEILFENDYYAVFGNIYDEYLYQSTLDDIINSKMICLAQVKRVFSEGTELMRNTMFNKIKDKNIKAQLSEAMKVFEDDNYNFSSTAVVSITNKPVYQIEIIALYQSE